jgi:hypothetical protein
MLIYFLNIISWLQQHQLPCMFKSLTHFDCPGCGLQGSFILLLKGNLWSSFKMYPALLPIILLFSFLIIHLTKKINTGATILKYLYVSCSITILISYIYKIINS